MNPTLLLDLDDTLLDTHIEAFLPAYFQALAGALRDRVQPEAMLAALMGGTQKMFANQDPALTLQGVFDEYFFGKLNVQRAQLQPEIDRFYDETFPDLGSLTAPRPAAVELVDWAFSRDYRVVIATNPLFPAKAILHRLRWAGLAPERYDYALVTSYENSHFTKSPAYYAEVLAHLGWPEDPVVMVGDEPDWDIRAPQALGIPVYHVTRDGAPLPELAPDGTGTIGDVRAWLEGRDAAPYQPALADSPGLLAALRGVPAGLASLLSGVAEDRWTRCPDCTEWSLNELICHLRDVDREVNVPRISILLAEANPFLAGEVTDPWAEQRAYDRQDGRQALRDWIEARKQLIALLEKLDGDGWQRQARHAIFGPTNLRELIHFITQHDQTHSRQVARTLLGSAG